MLFIIFLVILNIIPLSLQCYNVLSSKYSSDLDLWTRICSENGMWYLTMQDDGNAVGYDTENHKPFFATNTTCNEVQERIGYYPADLCRPQVFLRMQDDGNLVLYFRSNYPVWSTDTNDKGIGPYLLTMQNDRNIVLTDSCGDVLWSSNTTIESE